MYGLYHYEYSLKGNLEAMIQIQSLSHRYPKAETTALDNVSFDIADGECLGLLGHNGAGKTTLMSLLAGLQEVRQGEILFDGKPLRLLSRSERQKSVWCRRILRFIRSFQCGTTCCFSPRFTKCTTKAV